MCVGVRVSVVCYKLRAVLLGKNEDLETVFAKMYRPCSHYSVFKASNEYCKSVFHGYSVCTHPFIKCLFCTVELSCKRQESVFCSITTRWLHRVVI